jgi:hypothetical protein
MTQAAIASHYGAELFNTHPLLAARGRCDAGDESAPSLYTHYDFLRPRSTKAKAALMSRSASFKARRLASSAVF